MSPPYRGLPLFAAGLGIVALARRKGRHAFSWGGSRAALDATDATVVDMRLQQVSLLSLQYRRAAS